MIGGFLVLGLGIAVDDSIGSQSTRPLLLEPR